MNKTFTIAKKEFSIQFSSALAYISLIIMISVFNLFFFIIIDHNQEPTLRDVMKVMEFLFIFFIPLVTMKSFAEEKENGTMEFLMTSPVTNTSIVAGKYLGCLAFFTLIILATGIYGVILAIFSNPDVPTMITGYLGIWLEGAFFIAIGLMTSSWTKNQLLAAISSYVIIFMIFFSVALIKFFPAGMAFYFKHLNTAAHLANFASGMISTRSLIYYFSGILVCFLITRLSIENRLWR